MGKYILAILTSFICLLTHAQTITFGTPPELCANETQKNLTSLLNANPAGGKWVCNNCSGFDPIANDSLTFNPDAKPAGFNYELKYKYNNDSGTVNLKVNPLPNVTADANDYNACESETDVILTSSPAGGEWSGPGTNGAQDIFDATKSGVTKNANNRIFYTYKSPSTGCQSKDSIEIYVQKSPTINIVNDEPYNVCEGDIFELEVSYQNASTIYWYTNDGDYNNIKPDFFSTIINYTPNSNDIDRGSVLMYVETIPFSGDQCPAAIDSINLSILETPNGILDADSGCEIHNAELSISLDNKSLKENEVSYEWDFGDGKTETSQSNTVFHTYSGTGNMIVTAIINNKDLCFDTVENVVAIYEHNNAYFSVIPNDLTTNIGSPVFTFINETTGGDKPYTTTWNFGDGSPEETNPEDPITRRVTHRYQLTQVADSGNRYAVKLQVKTATGCIDEFNVMVRINPLWPLDIYPNPAREQASLTRHVLGDLKVEVMTPKGDIIRSITWDETKEELVILRNGLQSGIYYLIITDKDGNQRKEKIIFQ